MNGLQEIRQEGRQEGLQEGMHKRELDIAHVLRARGMDFSVIREITGVSARDLERKEK